MPSSPRVTAIMLLCAFVLAASLPAASSSSLPLALREVSPDKLSGGLFLALDSAGAFGGDKPAARARAGFPDLSKGRPPAVLDARVGVNVRIGDDPAALLPTQRGQAEPHIYRSAANPDLLLSCFQEGRFAVDGGALSCGYGVSRDGGLTWTRALIPQLTTTSGGPYRRATDPVAAIGPQGDLYLNTLGSIDNAFGLAAVVVSRSTNDGTNWSAPVVVFQSPNTQTMPDKNWLAVNDFPGAPNSGRLVVTWTNFTSNAAGGATGNNLVAAVSDDRGVTWSTPVNITPPGSNNQGTQPVFLRDGTLAVIYVTFITDTSQFSIQCKRSLDGGRTFPGASTNVVGFVSAWDDPEMRDGVFLPCATAARDTGELFVTYTALVGGSPRVLVTKSIDGGVTWSAPVIASDNPAAASVMNPAIAATPDGRTVSVVFMDKRLAPNRAGFVDHFAALSFDGGATWRPNLRLSEISSDIKLGPQTSRGVMLGDYLGLAPPLEPEQPFVAVWCDTRTGDSDPFSVRFAALPVADYNSWRMAHFNRLEAQYARGASFSNDDSDGLPNFLEYAFGTNPRRPESGEALVVTRQPNGDWDVAVATRPEAAAQISVERPLPPIDPVVGNNPPLPVPLQVVRGAGLVPNISPRPGLAWQTFRILNAPADLGLVPVGRGYADSLDADPGRPVSFGNGFALTNSNSRLINLASRGRSGIGASQLIVGFVIDGNKSILVRAAGPALRAVGVGDALADPRLALNPASDASLANDNWQDGGASSALFTRLGAFPFAPNSFDAALVQTLGAKDHTVIVSGANNGTGIALVEAYDADATPGAPTNPRLLNLSTRADIGRGENALIAGFVLGTGQPHRVLIRAVGPSLATFGVGDFLRDPMLNLYRGDILVAAN
ncbi:MAG TPA: sialidase family protein, partial [Opitutaceae bacterium]|nr:sialidase family protein [Opitutaceae bacterium]